VTDAILALNAGSSSLKFGLYAGSEDSGLSALLTGKVSLPEDGKARFTASNPAGSSVADEDWRAVEGLADIAQLLARIESCAPAVHLAAIGHRVVHGGTEFFEPVEIDERNLSEMEALAPLAPLHQPVCLQPVKAIRRLRPHLLQVACFDTAFHRSICAPAARYAIPRALELGGIRRFGFHGLSYESILAQLSREGPSPIGSHSERVIIGHLGNGASLCAIRGTTSVDTTMGFSTLDGLVMGTRPGNLDPGILLYLLREKGFSASRLESLLYRESGLLGVSGISSDVRILFDSNDPAAAEALDLFAFQVARQAAALATTLGGIDRLVFTGGIGEHSHVIRQKIVDRMQWLGATLCDSANVSNQTRISSDASALLIERRSTEEELAIARHVASFVHWKLASPSQSAARTRHDCA
jgi:acetate kinase